MGSKALVLFHSVIPVGKWGGPHQQPPNCIVCWLQACPEGPPRGQDPLAGAPAQNDERESVDVPSQLDTSHKLIVEVTFFAGPQRLYAGFGQQSAGQPLRLVYAQVAEGLSDDVQAYEVESITEVGTGADKGKDLDQPLLANLQVVARRGIPVSIAAESSSQIPKRQPEPKLEASPPAKRRRQDREGRPCSAGDLPPERSS